MSSGLETVLRLLLSYLDWPYIAIYMILCLTDLRPYLSNEKLLKLLKGGPTPLTLSSQDANLDHFRNVSLPGFWNSVSLLKRLWRYPSWPLSPGKLEISQLWSRGEYLGRPDGRILQVEFNPKHSVIAVVYRSDDDEDYFVTHWYSDHRGAAQYTKSLPLAHTLSLSWSPEGSYLLCKMQKWERTVIEFYKVCPASARLELIRGLKLTCSSNWVTHRLWLSDSRFVFPGFAEKSRVSRPWIYEIEQGGSRLKIYQPERRLRKEHPKGAGHPDRGCLKVLKNVDANYEVSVCQKEGFPEDSASSHCHSVVHFRNSLMQSLLSLSIPGFFVDAEGLSESEILILYRESSRSEFEPCEPTLAEDTPLRNSTSKPDSSFARASSRAPRASRVAKKGPFMFAIERFSCVTDSSSESDDESHCSDDCRRFEDVEKVTECNDDDDWSEGLRKAPLSELEKKKRDLKKTKRPLKKSKSPQHKKTKSEYQCSLSTVKKHRTVCKLFLAVYDLKAKKLVMNERLAPRWISLRSPLPERHDFFTTYDTRHQLSVECRTRGDALTVTENLLVVHARNISASKEDGCCLILHLGLLKKFCSSTRPSWHLLYMHPTKNVTVQVPLFPSRSIPISVGACLDLLVDHHCYLKVPLDSLASHRLELEDVEYVVSDEHGNAVEVDELRLKPAYGRVVWQK